MAKPELGQKRQCSNCGTKFFDLSRNPIVCPKCGTVFQTIAARPSGPEGPEEETEEPPPANVEMVPLDEVEATEEKAAEPVVDEIEVEDDEGGDEAFLEEEEEDSDDVSNLIDGEIAPDEEP